MKKLIYLLIHHWKLCAVLHWQDNGNIRCPLLEVVEWECFKERSD